MQTPVKANDLSSAENLALKENIPVICNQSFFADDRGWSLVNHLQGILSSDGQINYSFSYPRVIKAWHRHQKQTDFWACLHGHIRVGIFREPNKYWSITLGERAPYTLVIPPELWHGMVAVDNKGAGLLYYVTKAYCPENPDEERVPHDAFDFAWEIEHK